MERIFGVPAHPLSVHLPVVAIPVLAVVAVALVVRPQWRQRFGIAVTVLAIVTTISTFAAAASGEKLADLLEAGEYIETHRSLGLTLRWFVLGLSATVAALALVGRGGDGGRMPASVTNGLSAAVLIFAALSAIWVVRTGHEGAEQHWCRGSLCDDADDIETTAGTAATTTAAAEATTTTAAESSTTTTGSSTTEPPATTGSTTTLAPESTDTTDATDPSDTFQLGLAVFEERCTTCHGDDGRGIRGPNLQGIGEKQPDPAMAITQVTEGGGGMPAFGPRISEAEIIAVVDYIREAFPAPPA